MDRGKGKIVKIIDDMPGSGKTTYAFNNLFNQEERSFFYCTPYLNEVVRAESESGFKRAIGSVVEEGKIQNNAPKNLKGNFNIPKTLQLENFIAQMESISTTHESLKRLSLDVDLSNYDLVLDEVTDLISRYNLSAKTYELFKRHNYITVDEKTKLIRLTEEGKEYFLKRGVDNKYCSERDFGLNVDKGLLYEQLDDGNRCILISELPIEIFSRFKSITIMTWLFESSNLYGLLTAYGYEFEKFQVEDGKLFPWTSERLIRRIKEAGKLINLYEEQGNVKSKYITQLEETKYNFSASFKNKNTIQAKMGNIIRNYARNYSDGQNDFIYCVYKNNEGVRVKGFDRSFLSHNIRATNDYDHVSTVFYGVKRSFDPQILRYLNDKSDKHIELNLDYLRLSECLQFVFRSRIRKGEPINLFIADRLTRNLIKKYLY